MQPQLSRGKRFCDSTRSSNSARPNRCSLRLNYPPVTASRRLLAGLRKPQARRPPLLMKRCESAKQRGRRLRLFALKPSQNKDANFKCLRLALKLLQRWPQLWPNARSKSLQPSAPRRPLRASQAEQLRARRPLAKPKRARPPQSSAAKLWAQASAAATFTRPPFYKGARGESTKRRGQRVVQSKALSPNRRSCAFKRGTYLQLLALKSLQPWPQLWPNARSKSLQPSAPRWPLRASQAKQLRARRPVAKPKRARPPQSRAVKLWAQASAAATFTRQTLLRLNLLQLQRSTSAGD